MSIRIQRIINIWMILLSGLSVFFLGWRNIKRFSLSSFIVFLICCIDVNFFGKPRRWWSFYNKPQSFIRDELPFLIGPFFAGSMWTLKLAYGDFKKFITLNSIMQAMFSGPLTKFATRIKWFKLVQFNTFQFFLFFFYKAFILYGLQSIIEKYKKNELKRYNFL